MRQAWTGRCGVKFSFTPNWQSKGWGPGPEQARRCWRLPSSDSAFRTPVVLDLYWMILDLTAETRDGPAYPPDRWSVVLKLRITGNAAGAGQNLLLNSRMRRGES